MTVGRISELDYWVSTGFRFGGLLGSLSPSVLRFRMKISHRVQQPLLSVLCVGPVVVPSFCRVLVRCFFFFTFYRVRERERERERESERVMEGRGLDAISLAARKGAYGRLDFLFIHFPLSLSLSLVVSFVDRREKKRKRTKKNKIKPRRITEVGSVESGHCSAGRRIDGPYEPFGFV